MIENEENSGQQQEPLPGSLAPGFEAFQPDLPEGSWERLQEKRRKRRFFWWFFPLVFTGLAALFFMEMKPERNVENSAPSSQKELAVEPVRKDPRSNESAGPEADKNLSTPTSSFEKRNKDQTLPSSASSKSTNDPVAENSAAKGEIVGEETRKETIRETSLENEPVARANGKADMAISEEGRSKNKEEKEVITPSKKLMPARVQKEKTVPFVLGKATASALQRNNKRKKGQRTTENIAMKKKEGIRTKAVQSEDDHETRVGERKNKTTETVANISPAKDPKAGEKEGFTEVPLKPVTEVSGKEPMENQNGEKEPLAQDLVLPTPIQKEENPAKPDSLPTKAAVPEDTLQKGDTTRKEERTKPRWGVEFGALAVTASQQIQVSRQVIGAEEQRMTQLKEVNQMWGGNVHLKLRVPLNARFSVLPMAEFTILSQSVLLEETPGPGAEVKLTKTNGVISGAPRFSGTANWKNSRILMPGLGLEVGYQLKERLQARAGFSYQWFKREEEAVLPVVSYFLATHYQVAKRWMVRAEVRTFNLSKAIPDLKSTSRNIQLGLGLVFRF